MATEALALPRLVGRWFLNATSHVGRVAMLVVDLVRSLNEVRIWVPRMFTEAWNIGVGSLFIVLLISGFAGGVTALQARYQFTGTIPIYYLAGVIVESIVLELGPVLTGLILAGRIGARYAAELGTMRVTEQIDALESLGRSPSSHLIIPRVLAGLIMIPVLTVFADVMGIGAGWFSMKLVLPITDADFAYGARTFWRSFDATYSVDQGVLLRRLHHRHLVLHGVQHPAGRRGRGAVHHRRGREQLGHDPAARRRPHQAAAQPMIELIELDVLQALRQAGRPRRRGLRRAARARRWRCWARPAPGRACCSSTSSA